jgi:hypothetical protein
MFVEVYLFRTTAIKTKLTFVNNKLKSIEAMQCSFDVVVDNLFGWDIEVVEVNSMHNLVKSYYEAALKAYGINIENFEQISNYASAPIYVC